MPVFSLLVRYSTFALAILGFWLMSQVLQTIHASENAVIPPPTVTPPQKPYAKSIAGTGIVEALSENVAIGVAVPGLVTEVYVKVSSKVKKGDPLLKIDDRELSAQIVTQRAQVAVAQAAVELKKANLAKVEDMLARLAAVDDKRAISMDDLKNRGNDVAVAKADVGSVEAQLLAAQATVKTTEMLLERLVVKAPRDGTVLQANIRIGEYAGIQPKTAAMVLGDLDQLQVRCDIDEQNAVRMKPDMPAQAFIKGDAKTAIPLKFIRIEPYVIPKMSLTGSSTERVDTRVLQVIYSLDRPTERTLYVGQQVDIFIDAGHN
jgi:HlyD family secretion protein